MFTVLSPMEGNKDLNKDFLCSSKCVGKGAIGPLSHHPPVRSRRSDVRMTANPTLLCPHRVLDNGDMSMQRYGAAVAVPRDPSERK